MKLYLRNVKKGFATNSSSYHSTLILTDDEYQKWNDESKLFIKEVKGSYWTTLYMNKEKYDITTEDIKEAFSVAKLKELLEVENDNQIDKKLEELDRDGELHVLVEDSEAEVWYDGEYENEEEKYVTPSGEIIHILCKYGWN